MLLPPPSAHSPQRWDLFCRVIDNYGDIGVCWRLARQLATEYGLAVRLWVDDPASLAPLLPAHLPFSADFAVDDLKQCISGVEICHWPSTDFPDTSAADVVIEAFACELPAAYLARMAARPQPPVWFNLEYLSAEDWIEGCHGLTSPHPTLPLAKTFFFPGLTARTGGLLRERDLLMRLAARPPRPEHPLTISLFCYDNAPAGDLIDALSAHAQPVRLLVPPGKPRLALKDWLPDNTPRQVGNLLIEPIPFRDQDAYDELLADCDLNFVRGEDSFVRAQWAGCPFVWQIYVQDEAAHLEKLDAFLARYCADMPPALNAAVREFFVAWNTGRGVRETWPAFFAALPALTAANRAWAEKLAQLPDLAANLVKSAGKSV